MNPPHEPTACTLLPAQARRRLLVIAYYTAIVSLFTLFGVLIIPDVVREGADFVSRLQTENLWVVVLEKMRKGLG
jgi:predicted PurR-regulated permease PerM